MEIPTVLALIGAGVLGIALGYYLRYVHAISKNARIEFSVKERLLEAEEKALKIVEKAEAKIETLEKEKKQEFKEHQEKINKVEERLVRKEELLDQRQIDLDSETEAVRGKIDKIKAINEQLSEREGTIEKKYEEVAKITQEEARDHVLEEMKKNYEKDLVGRLQKLDRENEEHFEEKAREILTTAIYRIGNSVKPEVMSCTIALPNEEIKGKIIGKEGRNVKSFERLTGVDVLIDDTPGYITLSSFNPVRREIARVALEALLKDGRIQPAKIEEIVGKARNEVASIVRKMGEKAAFEAGVPDLHPEIIKIMGRLHFRTSYGQNVLWHSVEMAQIAGIIAAEIGARLKGGIGGNRGRNRYKNLERINI